MLFWLSFLDALLSARSASFARSTLEDFAAPSPAAALETYQVSFEIHDLNYYELSNEVCPKKVKTVNPPQGEGGGVQEDSDSSHGLAIIDHAAYNVHDNADAIVNEAAKALDVKVPPWFKEAGNAAGDVLTLDDGQKQNLLQVRGYSHGRHSLSTMKIKECTTIMLLLEKEIKETVEYVVDKLMSHGHVAAIHAAAPGPATIGGAETFGLAPAPATIEPLPPQGQGFFLSRAKYHGGASAPAPAMMAKRPEVYIFVAFSPGKPLANVPNGRSVKVAISFLDKPNNAMHDVLSIMPAINHGINTGLFHRQIKEAIADLVGHPVRLTRMAAETETIEQWPIHHCEAHIQEIVHGFSRHYTREQVPRALYNECTNFMTKISFSQDYVLDAMDTTRCKHATVKFTKKWNYGENSEASDFHEMCLYACEAKFGKNAPTCNIAAGDGILKQPA